MVMTLLTRPKKTVATVVVAQDGSGDTTDIQTGINLLPATGGVVYVREGTYTITETITIILDNVAVIGAGKSAIIQTALNIRLIHLDTVDGALIKDIFFNYTAAAAAEPLVGVFMDTCTESSVIECWFDELQHSIECRDSTGGIISLNHADNCNEESFWIIDATDNIISNNTITNSVESNILLTRAHRSVVTGNTCVNGSFGIALTETSDSIIATNICRDNDNDGIQLGAATCEDNIVIGNQLINNGAEGLDDNGTRTQIAHNVTT